MVQFLLILTFASLHLYDGLGEEPALSWRPREVLVCTLAGFAVLGLAFQALAMWCGRVLDRTGRVRAVRTAERGMTWVRLMAGAWWIFSLFGLGWLQTVREAAGDLILLDELLAMSPLLLLLGITWWSMYPIERRMRDALLLRALDEPDPDRAPHIHPPLTRGQYVWSGIRHQAMLILIPMTLLSGWEELVVHLEAPLARAAPKLADALLPLILWGGMLLVLVTTPALIRLTWDTVRIGPGPLRDQVRAMCRQYRVRVVGPILWRTHDSMVNGAILGVVYPLRFMLLTDALLERLSARQVEAVVAHEIAHVRRRHLLWLAVCVLASVSVAGWALLGVHHVVRFDSSAASAAGTGLALVTAGLVFGLVSRRFEWQADAFAVQHLSRGTPSTGAGITRDAIAAMTSALEAVAELNGVSPSRFSWRHGSIRERQNRLIALVDQPVSIAPIDRQVRWIKVVAACVLAVSIAPLLIEGAGAAVRIFRSM